MFKYLKKYWLFALLAPLFMVVEVLMDLTQPKMMSTIVDQGVLGLSNGGVSNLDLIVSVGLQMIGVVIIGGIAGILCCVFANLCSQNFGNGLRKATFEKIMSLSFEQMDAFSTGSLTTRVTNDINQVQQMVIQSIRAFIRTFMLFFGGILFLSSLHLSFGVVALCAVPVVLVSIIFFIRKANPLFRVLQSKLDKMNSVMQENVSGARVVKAYVREEYEGSRFGQTNDDLSDTQLKVSRLLSFMQPISNIVLNLSVVAILKIGSIQVQAGAVTPGSVMAAITYLSQIMHGVMMFAMIFQTFSKGLVSAKRINEVLACQPAIQDGQGVRESGEKGKVELRNVSFAYPQYKDAAVLDGIDLTIQPGECFAILGATGSGKTSLVHLLPRFYDVTQGSVLIDGTDVREYPLMELRQKIAIALQTSELFSGTIKDNILWGDAQADPQTVYHAADIAQATEFIGQKPEGMETPVAEKGMSLSGGQKQRIAISRAVLKKAEILILDDSTSALDLQTEAHLYGALDEHYHGMTKIIIAQRIASVQEADRIAVIENGKVVACGQHQELLQTSDVYQDIYNSQRKDGGDLLV